MSMEKVSIGENAGRIWHALNEVNEISMEELEKKVGLSAADVAFALGWLARENNVYIHREEDKFYISNGSRSSFFF